MKNDPRFVRGSKSGLKLLTFQLSNVSWGERKLEWIGTCRQKSLPAVVNPFFPPSSSMSMHLGI